MQKIAYYRAKTSCAEALAFWISLGAVTISSVYVIGQVLERTADGASIVLKNASGIDGLWQGSTGMARVSSLPDGIHVLLWTHGSGPPIEHAYHFLRVSSAGSAVAYVGNDDDRSTASWEGGELRLNLPGERLILRRP